MANIDSHRLAKAIAASGKKKAAIAKEIGVTPGTLSRYLGGSLSPDLPVLYNLSRVLTVTVEWLCGRASEESEPDTSTPIQSSPKPLSAKVQQVDHSVARDPGEGYLPDAVSLVGLNADERQTIIRMLDALRSGQADVRQHLIGQLKIIELVVQSRRKQPHQKDGIEL